MVSKASLARVGVACLLLMLGRMGPFTLQIGGDVKVDGVKRKRAGKGIALVSGMWQYDWRPDWLDCGGLYHQNLVEHEGSFL